MVGLNNSITADPVAVAVDVALDLLILATWRSAGPQRVNPYGNRYGNMTGEPQVTDPPEVPWSSGRE